MSNLQIFVNLFQIKQTIKEGFFFFLMLWIPYIKIDFDIGSLVIFLFIRLFQLFLLHFFIIHSIEPGEITLIVFG